MKVHFYKYQATGNDFVLIDNRSGDVQLTTEQIQKLCHRKFGIGADGLMLIEKHENLDFNLVYYNSDGSQSLCGNGSRAAVIMAAKVGVFEKPKVRFNAYDGEHEAEILTPEMVRLKMNDVSVVSKVGEDFFIHTGSPHYIRFVGQIEEYPVYDHGRAIRNHEAFKPGGTNVNFVEVLADNNIYVRTYERGVENETLSCGTGVTAAALAASFHGYRSPVMIGTLGGSLSVEFQAKPGSENPEFQNIYLIGPAKLVFEGDLEL